MSNQLTHKAAPSKGLIIAAFAAIYIIWGSTYIAVLFAIKDIPVFLMAGSRFFIAGIILYIWCRLKGQPTPGLYSIVQTSFSGILMLFFGTGAVAWVEQYISSGLTAIIVASVPLWLVLIDKRQWQFHFSNKWILSGLLIGFAGVLLLFADKKAISFSGDKMKLISFFVMIGGSISWAIGSLYSKYKKVEGTAAMKAAIQMMAAGLLFFVISPVVKNQIVWNNISGSAILAMFYLIFMGSLVGYISYIWLLSVRPPSLVGTYAYANPVVAVFLGWLLVHEKITQQQIIALVVILAGVILVNFPKDKS
jgi:drug/metabolite transporter (DMT)-like permease